MGLAKARRIAAREHRGRLFHGEGRYVDHLARVEAILGELGAGPAVREAAWLQGLAPALGGSARVQRIVAALRRPVGDHPAAFTERLLRMPAAALVQYAVLTDLHRLFAGQHAYEFWRNHHVRLAGFLGFAAPPALRQAERKTLPELLAMPRTTAVRAAIYQAVRQPADAADPAELRRLSDRWWESADDWERLIAVTALRSVAVPEDRSRLLDQIDPGRPGVASAAIRSLDGPADEREIALLARVAANPDPEMRWARGVAAGRLRAIGGLLAEAALRARYLGPSESSWRGEKLDPALVPTLIGKLADREWWHDAPFALGQLRAIGAVPALCELAGSSGAPLPAIEALGKIGSPGAVPTLAALAGHANPEVRDHVLRAWARIGGSELVDAAVAACDDPHPVVRDRAARVLARHGDRRAVTALIRLCDTAQAGRAVAALARIGDPRALPTLWHLFSTASERRVRHTAGRALAAIDGPPRSLARSQVTIEVWRAYIWLLGHKPDWRPHVQLRGALKDDDPVVRANAVSALGLLGDADSAAALADDPDARVRAHVTAVLGGH